jgi:GntR family transcriptional regulator/MocR family aminotransferase
VLSKFGQRVLAFPTVNQPAVRPVIDFRYGAMSADDFPTLPWKQAMNRAILRKQSQLSYSDPGGTLELRQALQSYLARARGLQCDAEQVIVVSGSQQALDLCARVLIDPGDAVVIENPCYAVARELFEAVGAKMHFIPVDQDGMRVDLLMSQPRGRLVYVTPSHQYPLGSILSVSRRQALLAWASKVGALIVEDDYDSEYRYGARPVEALQSLDRAGAVIYVSTFSKTLSPQLRIGYLVVPHGLVTAFTAAKRLMDRHTSYPTQAALAELLNNGVYDRHVRRVRRLNGERRATLLDAVQRYFGDDIEIEGADAGLNVVLKFRALPWSKERKLVEAATAASIGVHPLSPLYDRSQGRPAEAGLVLGYASLSLAEIERGIQTLAQIATRSIRPRGQRS